MLLTGRSKQAGGNVKVHIKELKYDIKNKGVMLAVSEPAGSHVGNLWITKARVVWYPGKKQKGKGRGHGQTWPRFIARMERLKKGLVG